MDVYRSSLLRELKYRPRTNPGFGSEATVTRSGGISIKIFSRSAEKEKLAAAPASAPPAAAPTPAPTGPAAAAAGTLSLAPASAPAAAAPPAPDISAIIDANVKEMSEKIARLATSIEGDKGDRSEFEQKLEKMEERMRKLSSLTEMISAQYNPFVGAAPSEREPMPQPEVGLAAPAQPLAAPPPPAPPVPTAPPPLPTFNAAEDPLAAVASALAPPMPIAPAPALEPMPAPEAAPSELFPDPPAFEAFHAPAPEPAFAAVEAAPTRQHPQQASDPARTADDDAAAAAARLWNVRPGFGSSMLMLSWADMLLKNAPDRNALVQLLDYYHNIAWIGPPARDQLLAYADGIRHEASAPSGSAGPAEWRASLEVHERSLLFVEKLRAIADGRKGD